MRPALELRQSQQLMLTPQLMQAIRLLQLSAAELEQEVEQAVSTNPFLERKEETHAHGAEVRADAPAPEPETSAASPIEEHDEARDPWSSSSRRGEGDDLEPGELTAAPSTLRDHLIEQAAGARLSLLDRLLVETVIEGLDDDGYLRQSLDELAATLPPQLEVDAGSLGTALAFVQSLDPVGVAARSVAECLELQLRATPDTPERSLALRIVREHLDLLAMHDSVRLERALGVDAGAVRAANLLIRRMDPRPGLRFGGNHVPYVSADVLVRRVGNRWMAMLNARVVPQIQVNRVYADALARARHGQGALAQQLQEARWLIRNVQQRFETIRRVAQAIVDRQRTFFELGELAMRPLVLRDIAAEVGLHPSTISRVTCNKYMDTPRGLIEFKRFFSSRVNNPDGGSCSSTAIRALIREIIAAEDPNAPLSDVQLTKVLSTHGIRVARRTVAKYRDGVGIAPVEARRMMQLTAKVQRRAAPRAPSQVASALAAVNAASAKAA
jgi:RNA polymerase sigma-54 factor